MVEMGATRWVKAKMEQGNVKVVGGENDHWLGGCNDVASSVEINGRCFLACHMGWLRKV